LNRARPGGSGSRANARGAARRHRGRPRRVPRLARRRRRSPRAADPGGWDPGDGRRASGT